MSLDDGASWQPLQTNLPHAPIYWLVVQERFNDLVVSTYGRGFWILDDITPLQQLAPDALAAGAALLKPRPAYRFREVTAPMAMLDDPSAGQNPPYGAAINYWLKTAPKDSVTITIADAAGQTVRTLHGPKSMGINRVWWDLKNEQTRVARLRTAPAYAPEVQPSPDTGRVAPGIGRLAVLMPPGTYTVKLKVGDQELTQPLEVRKDPTSGGSPEEIQTQLKLLVALQGDLNRAADMINQIEVVRSQLQSLRSLLADKSAGDVRVQADSLEKKFITAEETLHQLKVTGRGQDNIRWPARLAAQIVYLAQGVASSDFAPTAQQNEVHELFEEQLKTSRTRLDQLVSRDLAQFNEMLRQRNIGNVVAATQ